MEEQYGDRKKCEFNERQNKIMTKKMKFEWTVEQYYVETKKDEGPTNGRIGIRPKKRLNKKRCMFDKWQIRIWTKKMDKKQKSLHPSQ